jgi:hypothetical protein
MGYNSIKSRNRLGFGQAIRGFENLDSLAHVIWSQNQGCADEANPPLSAQSTQVPPSLCYYF